MVRDEARSIMFHDGHLQEEFKGKPILGEEWPDDPQPPMTEEDMAEILAKLRAEMFEQAEQDACERTYTTGTGQDISHVHQETGACTEYGCVIHAPSDHAMSEFPTHWRDDRGLMERICPHGIGHPDPDDLEFKRRMYGTDYANTESVHGCDGCCHGEDPPVD